MKRTIYAAALIASLLSPPLARAQGQEAINVMVGPYGGNSINCGNAAATESARALIRTAEGAVIGQIGAVRAVRSNINQETRSVMSCVENIQNQLTAMLNALKLPTNPLAMLDGIVDRLIAGLINMACAAATANINQAVSGVVGQVNGTISQFNNTVTGSLNGMGNGLVGDALRAGGGTTTAPTAPTVGSVGGVGAVVDGVAGTGFGNPFGAFVPNNAPVTVGLNGGRQQAQGVSAALPAAAPSQEQGWFGKTCSWLGICS